MIDLANKHWTTPAEINIKNHKWATKYYREFGRRIKNQEIWKYVLPRIAADRERLRMAKSPEEQIAILREQKSIEQYIEEAYELLGQQAYYAAQRERAKLRRGYLDDDRTLGEVAAKLAMAPEHREKSAKLLWIEFLAILAHLDLNPKEDTQSPDPRKWFVCFKLIDGERRIVRGTFDNRVSKIRAQKSH